MSRSRYYARAVATSYLQIAANIGYTMASIPLALHFLNRSQFGLWALVLQIAGYVQLLDLGMGPSVARILGDHKDDKDGGSYGSVLKTGGVVFCIQGVLVAITGTALAVPLSGFVGIPAHLRTDFFWLLVAQSLLLCLGFCLKIVTAPLWCHQRQDVINVSNVAGFAFSFAALWAGFQIGLDVYSLLLANATGFIISNAITIPYTLTLKLFPAAGHWGRITGERFRELFRFGGNFFIMQIGIQLVSASQIIVITRLIGLDAAAVWAIGTKTFTLAQQLIWRIFDSSAPALTEMFVRGEKALLRDRFRDLISVTTVAAILIGGCGAAFNGPFVVVWTHGKIVWPPAGDILMGFLVALTSITRCHTGFVGITKDIGNMRFIYLAEGICFVILAFLLAPKLGLPGVILASLCANVLFPGIFGVVRTANVFELPRWTVAFAWIKPVFCLVIGITVANLLIYQFRPLLTELRWLVPIAASLLIGASWLAWKSALSTSVRERIKAMIPLHSASYR